MQQQRIQSIDIIRGVVILLMALDHVRDLIHIDSLTSNPTALNSTTTVLFFTRWATHLCAPTFVFLSGVSAYLVVQKVGTSVGRSYLLKRGLMLILFEFTLINFGLWWDVHFNVFLFNVLAAIGVGFVGLSMVVSLRTGIIRIIALTILCGYSLVPAMIGTEASLEAKISLLLFTPGTLSLPASKLFIMGYPPVPWLAIMLLGYSLGFLYTLDSEKRRKIYGRLSQLCIFLFILLRLINIYGDLSPWTVQKDFWFSILSFINVTKYPPSLQFSLLFLGIMFLLFILLENRDNRFTRIMNVYGKVSLFYFVIHWYVIHLLLFMILFWQGYHFADFVYGFNFGRPQQGGGLSLWGVYGVWLLVMIIMYPLCKWYGRFKAENRHIRWLHYL